MHKIEVVVQADCVGAVSEALRRVKLGAFRTSPITLFDSELEHGSYRGATYALGRERIKLELTVADHEMELAVDAIRRGIDAFGRGDTDLMVLPIEAVLPIEVHRAR